MAVLGSVGYGAVWYYNDTQARIATLRENNAKLEVAVETAEQSINNLQEEAARNQLNLHAGLAFGQLYVCDLIVA